MGPDHKKQDKKYQRQSFWKKNGVKLSIAAVFALGIGGAAYLIRSRNDDTESLKSDRDSMQKSAITQVPENPPPAKLPQNINPKKDTIKYIAEKPKPNDTQHSDKETTGTALATDTELVQGASNNFENVPDEYTKGDGYTQNPAKNDSIKGDILMRDTIISPQIIYGEKNKSQSKITKTVEFGVEVEFWRSPIHYKGYKYFRNNLQLYGVHKSDNIKFYSLDGDLYMLKGGNYYKFTEEDAFNAFRIVTDKEILKLLGQ